MKTGFIIVLAFTGPDAFDHCWNQAHAQGHLDAYSVCKEVEMPSVPLAFSALAPERSIRPKARPTK